MGRYSIEFYKTKNNDMLGIPEFVKSITLKGTDYLATFKRGAAIGRRMKRAGELDVTFAQCGYYKIEII